MTAIVLKQLPTQAGNRSVALGSIEWLIRAIKTADTWRQRQKLRAQFAGLDHRILKDSGISEAQRFIEGNKPFWET